MTKKEFQEAKRKIDIEYNRKLDNLYIEYAKSNNPYKIGDIVSDNLHTIRIEKITVSIMFNNMPCCVYHGPELEKDLSPKKRQLNNPVWQTNIKDKLEAPDETN